MRVVGLDLFAITEETLKKTSKQDPSNLPHYKYSLYDFIIRFHSPLYVHYLNMKTRIDERSARTEVQ